MRPRWPSVWRRRTTPERHCANTSGAGWRNAAGTTWLACSSRGIGQWDRRLICTARDAVLRALPQSLQLRQLDLVVGHRAQVR